MPNRESQYTLDKKRYEEIEEEIKKFKSLDRPLTSSEELHLHSLERESFELAIKIERIESPEFSDIDFQADLVNKYLKDNPDAFKEVEELAEKKKK